MLFEEYIYTAGRAWNKSSRVSRAFWQTFCCVNISHEKNQIKTNNVLIPLLKEQFTQKIKNRKIDISYTGGHRSSYQKLLEQEKTVRGMSVYGTEST